MTKNNTNNSRYLWWGSERWLGWRSDYSTHVKARRVPFHACNPSIDMGGRRIAVADWLLATQAPGLRPWLKAIKRRVIRHRRTPDAFLWPLNTHKDVYSSPIYAQQHTRKWFLVLELNSGLIMINKHPTPEQYPLPFLWCSRLYFT